MIAQFLAMKLTTVASDHVDQGCDNFVTIFQRIQPKSAAVLAMAGGYKM